MINSQFQLTPVGSCPTPKRGINVYYPLDDHKICFVEHNDIDLLYKHLSDLYPDIVVQRLSHLYNLHSYPLEKVFFVISGVQACGCILPAKDNGGGIYSFSYDDFVAEYPDIFSFATQSYTPIVSRVMDANNMNKCAIRANSLMNRIAPKGFK